MPVSNDESRLVTSPLCLQLSTVMRLSPRPGELSYQIIAGAFIYFNHLTDQVAIWDQTFNSFFTKIRDENVPNFTSFLVNSLASFWAIFVFCKWSCCGGGNDSADQHSRQTPHLCCHSLWRTFVSPSPWSFYGTLSRGVLVCWKLIPACLSQAPR